MTLNVFDQLATAGADTLIWTGATINGRGGKDTVQLRYGEDLTGAELAEQLSNIEVIDLSIAGANAITGLTAGHVGDIVSADDDTLVISGGADDSLELSGVWVEGAAVDGMRTFTSELTEGNTMTVHVDGGVVVTVVDTTEGDLDSSSFSPFSTGFADSFAAFGLAHLETDEADADDDFLFGHDEQPELQAVLSSNTETGEDIGQWLPESEAQAWQQGSEQAPAQEAYSPEAYVAYAPDVTPLDDELRQSQQDAHVVG